MERMKFLKWAKDHWEIFYDYLENVTTEISEEKFLEDIRIFDYVRLLCVYIGDNFSTSLTDIEKIKEIDLSKKTILKYNFISGRYYLLDKSPL